MFPIVKLPILVFSKILNLADPHELISYALTSKKFSNLIKLHHRTPKNWKLRLDCVEKKCVVYIGEPLYHLFQSHVLPSENFEKFEKFDFSGHEALVSDVDPVLGHRKIFWNFDDVIGLKILIDWCSKLMKLEISNLKINVDSVWAMEWVEKRHKLKTVVFGNVTDTVTDEMYRSILESCNADNLAIRAIPPRAFRYPTKLPTRNRLSVEHGFWLTLDHLLTMDLGELCVTTSQLTCFEINQFLKLWISGGSPRLKFLYVQLRTHTDYFMGIEQFFAFGDTKQRVFKCESLAPVHLSTGSRLKRDDGVIASVFRSPTGNFGVAVWPDIDGTNY